MSLSRFFGVAPFLGAETADEHAPSVHVLADGHRPRGEVTIEVEPYLRGALKARGLPRRFRVRADRIAVNLPRGDVLATIEDDWPRRPIAVRTGDGDVVLGFDPDKAIARMAAEERRSEPEGEWRPTQCELLRARYLGSAPRPSPSSDRQSIDALRFFVWALLEEAADTLDVPMPQPFWPDRARLAVALAHDVATEEGLSRISVIR
ncbi:MAG: hypothetical protein ACYTFT_07805, partial [Planctomycetota bacterium]